MRRSIVTVTTVAALLGLGAVAAPAEAGSWSTPRVLPGSCDAGDGVEVQSWTNAGGSFFAVARTKCGDLRLLVGTPRSGYHVSTTPFTSSSGVTHVLGMAHDTTGTYFAVEPGDADNHLALWKRTPDGGYHLLRTLSSDFTGDSDVRIVARDGRWFAAWSQLRNGHVRLLVARTLAEGDGTTHQLTTPPDGYADGAAAVALHAGGPFVVTYARESADGSEWSLYARRFRFATLRWDPAIRVVGAKTWIMRWASGAVFQGSTLRLLVTSHDMRPQGSAAARLYTMAPSGALSSRWAPPAADWLTVDGNGRPAVAGRTLDDRIMVGTLGTSGWTTTTPAVKTGPVDALTPTTTGVAVYYEPVADPSAERVVWR